MRAIADEWPLLNVQRSIASQDDKWQVPEADVIGLQNLTDRSQPSGDFDHYGAGSSVSGGVSSM